MSIDNRCHIELLCQITYQSVYQYGSMRVKSRIRFIAEEEGRLQGNCPGYSDPFLHSTAEFVGILVIRTNHIDLFKTVVGSFQHLRP